VKDFEAAHGLHSVLQLHSNLVVSAAQIAIPLLESHVVLFPNDLRCFDSLIELYRLVSLASPR
jgi:hypothetical protein